MESAGRTIAVPARIDGFAPIGDYAAIGDGRTVALVASDGSIDWLCLPDMDSPPLFGALLDAERGGYFALGPDVPSTTTRRYVPRTNVLETTFASDRGICRVTDALTLTTQGLSPARELVRVVDGVRGRVPVSWVVDPRFDFGRSTPRLRGRTGVAIADAGADAIAVRSFDAGNVAVSERTIRGQFETREGSRSILVMSAAHQEPVVVPTRRDVEVRLAQTVDWWRAWAGERSYEGIWSDAVVRSALALKLLVYSPSGAVAAAPTTSLPERVGGERNWDYRFCWLRDSAFIMNALLQLGCTPEAEAFFWWLMHASQLTHPSMQVLYRLDGGALAREQQIPSLRGYRDSRPVRVGNGAVDQVQLDIYGDVMHAAWLYANSGRRLDAEIGRRLAGTASLVSRIWRQPDAGMWEVRSAREHFTQSKMMCWVALDRAVRLADDGQLPDDDVPRWRSEMRSIAEFIDRSCWSTARQSYTRYAGSDELDASLLLGLLFAYGDPHDARMLATIDAIRRELAHGPFVYRYTGDDGLRGEEGAFLACSFWLVEALALLGQRDTAGELMGELIAIANDVGLYAEEVDPESGEFLGNFPQGLTHLALVNAAIALDQGGPR